MGVQLVVGQNIVAYRGASQSVQNATAAIKPQLRILWVYTPWGWVFYDPNDPIGSTLGWLLPGQTCWVNMNASAYWALADALVLRAKITSVTYPTSAKPGDTITIAATIRNDGNGQGWFIPGFSYAPYGESWITIWGDWVYLSPGESWTWTFYFTMPSKDCNVYCAAWYGDPVANVNVQGDSWGVYTIAVVLPVPAAQVKTLEVGYVKV